MSSVGSPVPGLLVLGLSGPIGAALRGAGLPAPALALTRRQMPIQAGIEWCPGDLEGFRRDQTFDSVLSLGPLDALARAVAEGRIQARRIVALGSTSVQAKADSPDPVERAVAARLLAAESTLRAHAGRQGLPLFLLRPTLVWGSGRDASLSRVVALARRWPLLPLPLSAPGRRQPVHVDDLAAVVLRALAADPVKAGAYDLPGGETLAFGEMLRRSVAAAAPRCRLLPIPWRWLVAGARFAPKDQGGLARLGQDQCFDAEPARRALGWAPRGFAPKSSDFIPMD